MAFRHEALFYAGDDGFLAATLPFVAEGIAKDEPVLVVVSPIKIDLLRASLPDAGPEAVKYAAMDDVGRNPACIIPAWLDFVAEHSGDERLVRGIGEPITASRTTAELAECHRHEGLLNVAFADAPPWWLVCPYDTAALRPDVVAEAHRTHPFVRHNGSAEASTVYDATAVAQAATHLGGPLTDPPSDVYSWAFELPALKAVRAIVTGHAIDAGLDDTRIRDLVIAANEAATNCLRHGGGHGVVRLWSEGDWFVCEISGDGTIADPLVGRTPPPPERPDGRGVWLVHHLCDLVQVRSDLDGSVVRMHMRRA